MAKRPKSGLCEWCGRRTTRKRDNRWIHQPCETAEGAIKVVGLTVLLMRYLKTPEIQQRIRDNGAQFSEAVKAAQRGYNA